MNTKTFAATPAHNLILALMAIGACATKSGPLAILVGAIAATLFGTPKWSVSSAKKVLAVSVVGLGAGMNISAVLEIGLSGILFTMLTLSATVIIGLFLSHWIGLGRDLAALITVGTAICGGSAIAAVAPLLRAKSNDIAASLGVVFVLNAIALYIFPAIGNALEMDAQSYGLWCAFAIHDTSSVVGAAGSHSPEALEVATVTKLSRALWIIPVGLLLSMRIQDRENKGKVKIPFFILAFLAVVLLVSFLPSLQSTGQLVAEVARYGMVLALFAVGLSLSPATLKQLSGRSMAFGISLWLILAVGTLAFLC